MGCEFELANGDKCDLGNFGSSIYCEFHKHVKEQNIISDAHERLINQYIQDNKKIYLDFSNITFKNFTFKQSHFGKKIPVKFVDSVFQYCTFKNLKFIDSVDFSRAHFINPTFEFVTFTGQLIDFTEAIFENQETSFKTCIFEIPHHNENNSGIDFTRSNFKSNKTPFLNCFMKSKKISFNNSSIDSDRFNILLTDKESFNPIYLSLICDELDLDLLFFENLLEMKSDKNKSVLLYLRNIDFSQMNSVLFDNVNFEKTLFTNSNLENVKFVNPKWLIEDRRKILYDEKEKTNNEELQRLYIQLKRKYEQWGDYPGAGDWYYREAQARRRLSRFPLIYFLYHLFSRYGESYGWPLFYIASTYTGFSLLYLFSGFKLGESYINYDLFNGGIFKWSDIGNAFVFSLLAMIFQLGRTIVTQDTDTIFIYGAHLLLTLILVPLFLLALRRKFRR